MRGNQKYVRANRKRNGENIMAVTIQDIAEAAGVSRGTVDRALNNRGRINPDVARHIQEIAKELGYMPRRKKNDNVKKQVKIGVVTQLSKASFMIQVKKGIEDARRELADRDVELILEECMTVDENEQLKAIDKLSEQGVSGIAVMPVECNKVRDRINRLVGEEQIPVVTFNSDIVGTKRSCFVGLDNKRSGQTAAGLMGIMTGGKGKVLVITGYFGNSVNSMRVDGFVEEIKISFPGMELVGVQSSFDETAEVERIITNTMDVFPDLAGIVVVSGGQAGIRNAFEKISPERRPFVIIYDLTPKNVKALKDGVADFLIDQNGYTQGYRSLFVLSDILQKGQEPLEEYLYTDIIIKNKYNV